MPGKQHPLVILETLVLIAVGGFAGSNLRVFVEGFLPGLEGTLLVNVLGSFALGFGAVLVDRSLARRVGVRVDPG